MNGRGLNPAAMVLLAAVGFAITALSACKTAAREAEAAPAQQGQAASVVLYTVEKKDLGVQKEYIGKVEAIQTVDIRPQIAGEIAGVNFKEGSIVKEGDLLFTLDPAEYQATVALRQAELAKAEASSATASRYHARLKNIGKDGVSASNIDTAAGDAAQAKAQVAQAKAQLRLAQIDLGRTKIKAPITGRIGKAGATKGNYVTPSASVLANIVLSLPVALLGALIGVVVINISISIYTQLGILLLIGLAAKNAILIIEFAVEQHDVGGLSILDAAAEAGSERFRSVMMTAITCVCGVLPMLFATGAGAGSRLHVGITMFFGMSMATAFGIFLIPGLYVFLQTWRERIKSGLKRVFASKDAAKEA